MEIDRLKIVNVERMIHNLIHDSAVAEIMGDHESATDSRQVATDYAIVLQELGIRDYAKEENKVCMLLAIIAKINRKIDELRKDK